MWSSRRGASFTSDRVQDSDKDEDPLGKMWEWGKRPEAGKLGQRQCSFQLLSAKPLKKFTHRHSTYSANIGYFMRVVVCHKYSCMCTHFIAHLTLASLKVRMWMLRKKDRIIGRKGWWKRAKRTEKVCCWCFSDDSLSKTDHEICFFTGSDRPSTMNWSPDGDLALFVVIFFSAHLPAQILDNLHAAGIPNPTIHPHLLCPCVSQDKTRA